MHIHKTEIYMPKNGGSSFESIGNGHFPSISKKIQPPIASIL